MFYRKQRFYFSLLLVFTFAVPAEAGLFGPWGNKKHQLSFRNWSDQNSDGYCFGMTQIEQRFNKSNHKQLFNTRAPKDSSAVVEQKMRAYLNGNPVVFNGYDNLNDMSSEHELLFKKLTKEIQLAQSGGGDPARLAKRFPKSENSNQLFNRLSSGQSDAISIYDSKTDSWHMVKAIGYDDRGTHIVVKVNDPNKYGTQSISLQKDSNGRITGQAYYSGWNKSVQVTDTGSNPINKIRISRNNRYARQNVAYNFKSNTSSWTH